MFCHTLALALGKTVREVQEQVSPEEFKWWMAYNRISPIGPERMDLNCALIAQAIYNVNRTKGKPLNIDQVRLKWNYKKPNLLQNKSLLFNMFKQMGLKES